MPTQSVTEKKYLSKKKDFNIFINYVDQRTEKAHIRFADDTKLVRIINIWEDRCKN